MKRGVNSLSLGNLTVFKLLGRLLLVTSLILILAVTGRMNGAILALRVNLMMKEVTARMLLSTSFERATSQGPDAWARNLTDELRSVRNAVDVSINAIIAQRSAGQVRVDTLCRLNSWLGAEAEGGLENETCQGGVVADAYRGAWLWAQGSQDKAIRHWRRTNIAAPMLRWARQLAWENRPAAFAWAELARTVAKDWSACFTLQWLYGIEGRWDDSLEAYQCVLTYGNVDVRAHRLAAGSILYGSGDLREAIETYGLPLMQPQDKAVMALREDLAHALLKYDEYVNHPRCEPLNGRAWDMTQYYGHVMGYVSTLDTHLSSIYLLLGNAFEMAGDAQEATTWYQRLVQTAPTDCASHQFLGHAYLLAGHPEMASSERSLLRALCPSQAVGW